jgi:hypothetical protein
MTSPAFLISGPDTVEVAYYLRTDHHSLIDFDQLIALRDGLKEAKTRHPALVKFGNEEFLLASHGTRSGYPLLLENESFSIQCGQFNQPSFFVTYRSIALWHEGLIALHDRFLKWARSMGLSQFRDEKVSRLDYAFDYHIPTLDFDEDQFVSAFVKDNQHRKNGIVQTFRLGEGDLILRCYNKSDEISESSNKIWLYDLWGRESDVWRIEWQARKEWLRNFGIETVSELNGRQGVLLSSLVNDHTKLCSLSTDSNKSRWPLHPLWIDLQKQVKKLPALDTERVLNREALLDERFVRLTISVYGYLKRLAAIRSLQASSAPISLDSAFAYLQRQLHRIHEPLTWELDVQRRMNEMRLGES